MSIEGKNLFVCFRLGNGEYGVGIHDVQEIIRVLPVTPVPGSDEHIEGAMNLRGEIVPIVSPHTVFGISDQRVATEGERIVILRVEEKLIGMRVDAVTEVLKIPQESVVKADEAAKQMNLIGTSGIFSTEERLVVLLDPLHLKTVLLRDRESFAESDPSEDPEKSHVG